MTEQYGQYGSPRGIPNQPNQLGTHEQTDGTAIAFEAANQNVRLSVACKQYTTGRNSRQYGSPLQDPQPALHPIFPS